MDENQTPGSSQPGESTPPSATPPSPEPMMSSSAPTPSQPSTPPSASTPPPMSTPPPPISTPPPFSTPPPVFTAPPRSAAAGGRGRGWMVLSLVLLVILAIVLFGSFAAKKTVRAYSGSSGKSIRHKHEVLEEVTLEDNGARAKILVIEISGVISSADMERGERNMVENIAEQLKAASDDRDIKAVLLKVNSPGGEVLASDEIYRAIVDFQTGPHGKPVIASMQTLAASGGYYVSAPCRWIVANELTITGSIGVIMHGFNYRGLMNKVGLRPMIFKSGKFKDMLSGDKDLDTEDPTEKATIEEEKQMVQDLIMETYSKFTNIVQTGRSAAYTKNSKNKVEEDKGRPLADDWTSYIDGRVLSGKKAYDLGFVDELGNFETAKDRALAIAGLSDANYVQYQRPFDFGNLFRLLGSTESRASTTLKVDLGVNAPKLQVGQLYFIAPTSVPQ